MPGLVLALVAVFPGATWAWRLAAILMIFTGQAWNMTFSFYHSSVPSPPTSIEVVHVYRFRLVAAPSLGGAALLDDRPCLEQHDEHGRRMVLPHVNEAFLLGDNDFRLPGLGSYMSVAVDGGVRIRCSGPCWPWS